MGETQEVESRPGQTDRPRWHALRAREVVRFLDTSADLGLVAAEVARRRLQHGVNALEAARRTSWQVVLGRQFVDVLILILLAAASIAFVIGEIGDAVTILAIVLLNGLLGFVQEWKAEKAMEALQRMLTPHCRVIRGGEETEIDARDLVPGDIVALAICDRIPADIRLLEATNLKTDESTLTGESVPVNKSIDAVEADTPLAERFSIAWLGTSVTNGRARGIVVDTGMATELGRIAHLTQTVGDEATLLQRKLARLGKQLGVFSIAISVLVALAGMVFGKPLIEMFFVGVSLAVAVVPEGLPAVVTITMALGIRAMVRRRALLRRLQAAETLGSASVICTDKTGTLTQNEMTVTRMWVPGSTLRVTGVGYEPSGHFEMDGHQIGPEQCPALLAPLETGLVCNHARVFKDGEGWRKIGEPTEAALVVAAYKAGLHPEDHPHTVSEFSFNSLRKRMTVVVHRPEGIVAHVKGAPEVLLPRCSHILEGETERSLTEADRQAFTNAFMEMASTGLRTLALARRMLPGDIAMKEDVVEQGLTLLGVVGIIDPPRREVPDAVQVARQAGVRVIMITGDAPPTAVAIARRIGLAADRAITGTELARMEDGALDTALEQDVLFARTTPENKLRIVTRLQRLGHVVGMTGDGVNDAPALKKADIGIAMGQRGTAVAKGASEMVLTDDNFASIIGAIEEGRRQYENIRKFVRYLLFSNTAEVVAIFFSILLGGPLILLPVQILWMNLVTDGMTAVALGVEPPENGIMKRPPRATREPILDRIGILAILLLGGYMGCGALWLFHHYVQDGVSDKIHVAQTVAFTGIIVLEKMNVFNFRALREPLAVIGFFSNPWLLLAWVGTLGLQVCAVYVPFLQKALHTVPIGGREWGLILVIALPVFAAVESYNWLRWRRSRTHAV